MTTIRHPATVEREGLVWNEALGRGYYPVQSDGQYDKAYWSRYAGYTGTPAERELNLRRVALVEKHAPGQTVVDIGIGAGHFILARAPHSTYGYDVNPRAVRWLVESGLWFDPWARDPDIVTTWDALEHLSRPEHLVVRVRKLMFVSIPIFTGLDHILRSKHFRKDEHFVYFTRDGFVAWMGAHGFTLRDENTMEVDVGREDIGTFVFARTAPQGEVPF
ncbi:MAG: class I SAM-dependent methyltransferase [Egibacteraceae bacterium]